MIYLVEINSRREFLEETRHNDYIDSAWSSLELAEARIKEIEAQIKWFFSEGRVSFKDANEDEKKVIKKWSPMIGWDYDYSVVLEFKIDEV